MNAVELKAKYKIESDIHDPNPDCDFCKGTGEKRVKRTGDLTFCICLFVDHSASNDIGKSLNQFATKELDKMRLLSQFTEQQSEKMKND